MAKSRFISSPPWPWFESILPEQIIEWGMVKTSTPSSYEHYASWVKEWENEPAAVKPLGYLFDERAAKRADLRQVYPDFQCALVFLFDYRPAKKWLTSIAEKWPRLRSFASFAFGFAGTDYHHEVRGQLQYLLEQLQEKFPGLQGEVAVDTKPILERDLAFRAGLGWFGKNSLLIHRTHGSFVMIASLLLNQEIPDIQATEKLETDHCGQCRRCVDACPTAAIDGEKRQIVPHLCLSTYTVETFKAETPAFPLENVESAPLLFGCDICQDVCPWNKRGLLRLTSSFTASAAQEKYASFFSRPLEEMNEELQLMSKKKYKEFFFRSSWERLGKNGLLKNIKLLLQLNNFHSPKDGDKSEDDSWAKGFNRSKSFK